MEYKISPGCKANQKDSEWITQFGRLEFFTLSYISSRIAFSMKFV